MSFQANRSQNRRCVSLNNKMLASVFLILVLRPLYGFANGHNHNDSLPTNYDPMRGYYMASFENPHGKENCSIFWVSTEFFLLDGCPTATLQGLDFYIKDEKIRRLIDTKYGALLEFSEILPYKIAGLQFSVVSKDRSGTTSRKDVDIPAATLMKNSQFSIPKSDVLNSLYFNEEGGSSSVYIMNVRTFLIPHLKFTPAEGDNVFFWVGNARNGPDSNGTQIPNEKNSYDPLRAYKDEMVVLTLPPKDPKDEMSEQMTVYDINYIGLWSPSRELDYDYIRVRYPDDTKSYFAPPTFYFNRYLIEGVILCPPANTFSPTIKYNLSHSGRNCSGDCCHNDEIEENSASMVYDVLFSSYLILQLSLAWLLIAKL